MIAPRLSLLEHCFYPCLIPSDDEMFVKNADGLKNVPLCPFLRDMDEQEHVIQTIYEGDLPRATQEQREDFECCNKRFDRRIRQIVVDSSAGAILSGLALAAAAGPILVLGCGVLGVVAVHMRVLDWVAREHGGIDAGRPRINRLARKIENIIEKQQHLDHTADADQLNKSRDHFQKKVDRYNLLYAEAPLPNL